MLSFVLCQTWAIRRFVLAIALFISLQFLSPVSVFCAQPLKEKALLGIGLKTSQVTTGNSTLDNVDSYFDATSQINLNLTYAPSNAFSIELAYGSMETDVYVKANTNINPRSERFGKFRQTSIQLTPRAHIRASENIYIYIGAGVSYLQNAISSSNLNNAQTNDFFAINKDVTSVDNSIGGHGVAGLQYWISKNITLNSDLLMTFTKTKASIQYPDSSKGATNMSLSSFRFGFGAKYYFDL